MRAFSKAKLYMTPQEYCQDRTSSSGSSFYYSFLFLPADTRRAITALYAFCREVDDVVDECHEVTVAQKKMDWWRSEISQAFVGRASHPVCRELQTIIPQYRLRQELFEEIINGMQMDLTQARYATLDELKIYCYRAASAVGLLSAKLFGYKDAATETYAHDLGMAFQLTNIIRDVREDAQRDRIYLPQDMMKKYGVDESSLQSSQSTPELRALLRELSRHAENYYQSAMQALPDSDRWNQRAGLIMSSIYHAVLDRIQKNDFDVMARRTCLPTLLKLWLAWRTVHSENRLHKKYLKSANRHAA